MAAKERRVQRQMLIGNGWQQYKLDEAMLVCLGEGKGQQYAALLASCVEFGRILISNTEDTNGKQTFMGRRMKRKNSSKGLAEIIHELNDNISVEGFSGGISAYVMTDVVKHFAGCYIHAGNEWKEKRTLLSQFQEPPGRCMTDNDEEFRKHFALTAGNDHELRLGYIGQQAFEAKHLMPQFEGQKASKVIGLAQGALGIGELVARMMGIGNELDRIVAYNLLSSKRTSHVTDLSWKNVDLSDKTIVVVGDGAVGTMYKEAIWDLGVGEVVGWDFDRIELSNMARAPHFVGHEGWLKAYSNAKHFNARNSKTRFKSRNERFTEHTELPKVDLMICAVDGYDNQMAVINYSQRNQVPLLLGGCSAFTSAAYEYVPKETCSMLYQYDFLRHAYIRSVREKHRHCQDADAEGSNMITTALCAAMLAGETINYFSGNFLKGQMYYDMLSNPRLSYFPIEGIRDLGTDIPEFVQFDKDEVSREIVDGKETIKVRGEDFEEWYRREGDVRNR